MTKSQKKKHRSTYTKTLLFFPPSLSTLDMSSFNGISEQSILFKKYKWTTTSELQLSTSKYISQIPIAQEDIDSLETKQELTDRILILLACGNFFHN